MRSARFPKCLLALVIALVGLRAATLAAQEKKNTAVIPVPREQQKGWTERHEAINARAKQGNVDLIFFGDSITEGWASTGKRVWEKFYGRRNAVNAGISSDRTQNVLWRLDHGNVDGISPKLAVLLIGTNTMGETSEQVCEGIKAVADKLREKMPKTKVLVLAILPRGKGNEAPAETNKLLPKIGDDKNVFVLDINHNFVAADGTPKSELMQPDMLHLSAKGYETWAESIESEVVTLMGEKEDPTMPVPLQLPREAAGWMRRHEAISARVKQGNVDLVFIGDSITNGWENAGREVWNKFYGHRNAANLGISRDRTQQALWRLDHGNLEGIAPKLAVVMIGTNNSSRSEIERIPEGIRAIVERFRSNSANTKVLLLAIFPRGANNDDPWRKVNMQVNKEIAKFADEKAVFFLDINAQLVQPDGALSKEIMPDLLHPSAKGYQIWAEVIEPMVAKLMGEMENPSLPAPRLDVDWWLKRHELNNARAKESNADLIFIGDSITQGWELPGNKDVWDKFYGKRIALNLGISGDRTQHVLWRLEHGNIDGISPKLAVVMIGTNNSSRSKPEEIPDGVKAVVDCLRAKLPQTKILLLAIFPRGENNDNQWRQVNAQVNKAIAKFADEKTVFFRDINSFLLQPDGTLSKEIMPDLLHPGPKGYQIWAEAIESTVARLMGERESAVLPIPRPERPNWMSRYESMNARVKQGDCDLVFIGDSITEGWETAGKEVWQTYYGGRKAVNLGIGGDRTQHVLWRLDHGNIEGIAPKLAVMMIGTNNIGGNTAPSATRDTPEQIAEGVKAIVERLRTKLPDTKVLLLGIFPRGEQKDSALRQITVATNELLAKLADDKTVYYLDIGPKFLTEDGTLTKEVMPDLVHLTPKSYAVWAEAIEPMVAKLLGQQQSRRFGVAPPVVQLHPMPWQPGRPFMPAACSPSPFDAVSHRPHLLAFGAVLVWPPDSWGCRPGP